MICINCFHRSTSVINSRPHKKQASIWRRRKCPKCSFVFTTTEQPSLADNKKVSLPDNKTDTFSLSKLCLSIAGAFTHSTKKAAYDSLWLAKTVEQTLSTGYAVITPDDIAAVTHQVLKNYDELAAVQYAAKYQLIASTRRRGRPSISPSGRAPQTDESPSR